MPNRDAFSSYHPVINFMYFALVLVFSMFFMHPVSLLSSPRRRHRLPSLPERSEGPAVPAAVPLPMALMAALINPAFNHEGATLLAYLPLRQPLTLESIAYGFAAAPYWLPWSLVLPCYTAVMTSDKFVYLFGPVIPALNLVLSMTLRFVPQV